VSGDFVSLPGISKSVFEESVLNAAPSLFQDRPAHSKIGLLFKSLRMALGG